MLEVDITEALAILKAILFDKDIRLNYGDSITSCTGF